MNQQVLQQNPSNKLLMGTVKRDIPAVEASYELSSLPLYRSSHTFQNISVSGFRQIEKESNGIAITKKYCTW